MNIFNIILTYLLIYFSNSSEKQILQIMASTPTTEDNSEEKVSKEMESEDAKTQTSNSQCCYFPKRYAQAKVRSSNILIVEFELHGHGQLDWF